VRTWWRIGRIGRRRSEDEDDDEEKDDDDDDDDDDRRAGVCVRKGDRDMRGVPVRDASSSFLLEL